MSDIQRVDRGLAVFPTNNIHSHSPFVLFPPLYRIYYNGVKATTFSNLVLRTSDSISSAGGIYFSTFFGGDDAATYATPTEQSLYFKDMQVFGAAEPAQGDGEGYKLKNAAVATGKIAGDVRVMVGAMVGLVAMVMII